MIDAKGREVQLPIKDGRYSNCQMFQLRHNIPNFGIWIDKHSCISKYVFDVLTDYDIMTNTHISRVLFHKTWNKKTKKSKRRTLKSLRVSIKKK